MPLLYMLGKIRLMKSGFDPETQQTEVAWMGPLELRSYPSNWLTGVGAL